MKKIFLFAILCLVSTYAIAQARLTGKLNNFMGGNAIVIRLTDTGRLNDTLSVNADGTFAASLKIEKPGNAYLLFEEQHQSMEFFLEDGMQADLQITFTETLVDGKPQTDMSVTYSGDNKDCYDFIRQNGVIEHYKNWPFERINGMPFKVYRQQIEYEYEENRAKLNKVKSIAFRRITGKEVDEQLTRDICRWAWGKNKQKDADFDHWMASFDHNDPQNDMTYNYWRRYEDIHPLPADAPAIARYERLKQAFDNQEIINRLADSMIQNTLKDAPENMDEELTAYKATSTNKEGHAEADRLYAHYSKLKKGAPAADFDFYDKAGKRYTLKNLRGKAIYIDCWATWCGPCCAEIPYMEKLYEHYKKNKKVELISISLDDNRTKWEKKLKEDKPGWRQFICPDNFKSMLCKNYDINGIPRFLMIDKKGCIISLDAPRPSYDNIIEWIDGNLN